MEYINSTEAVGILEDDVKALFGNVEDICRFNR